MMTRLNRKGRRLGVMQFFCRRGQRWEVQAASVLSRQNRWTFGTYILYVGIVQYLGKAPPSLFHLTEH